MDFTLLPCGSVHVGNKVNNFDELDFMLIWNVGVLEAKAEGQNHLFKVTHTVPNTSLREANIQEVMFRKVRGLVDRIKGSLARFHVTIDAVVPHRRSPGIYMCLSWKMLP